MGLSPNFMREGLPADLHSVGGSTHNCNILIFIRVWSSYTSNSWKLPYTVINLWDYKGDIYAVKDKLDCKEVYYLCCKRITGL